LETDTHENNVQVDIDVGTAGCGKAGLSHKVSDYVEKSSGMILTTGE